MLSKIKFGFWFQKELKRITEIHRMDEEQLCELKNKEFVNLYRHAFKHSRFYNDLYRKHGLNINSVKSLDDLELIPIITKEDIRDRVDDILTTSKLFVYAAYTSGTTGSPLKLYRDIPSICKEAAYNYFFERSNGYQLGDKMVSIKGDLDKSEIFRFDKSLNVLHLSSYNLNEQNIEKYYQLISDFQPKIIAAYPSSLQILSIELFKLGKELHIPLAFTSSEVLHDFQRKIVEKVLHTKIFDWYGNSERTIAFAQIKDHIYQDAALYGHYEVNEHNVVTTGFINRSFPLIRYMVEDVIELRCKQSGCSRYCATKIRGRDNQYILLKNGQQVGLLDHAFNFSNIKNIMAAQIVQSVAGEIDLNIIPDENYDLNNKNELLKNLTDLLGEDCTINYQEIDDSQIIRSECGKFNLMVSYLRKQNENAIVSEILNKS